MAALKHDHVVTIYQVGQHRGVPYLAMEYSGHVAARLVGTRRKPSVDLILRLGREIAAGLAAAHRRPDPPRHQARQHLAGSPDRSGQDPRLRPGPDPGHDVQITKPGSAVGTPAFMAPEQAAARRGPSSDLFSLGCVLYRLCTGRLPFPGTTVIAVLTSLSMDTPPPPGDLNPALPPALADLIVRLLAKQPSDRPPSAQAVVEAIKGIERELLIERQKAELSITTPLPPAGDTTGGFRATSPVGRACPSLRRSLAAIGVRSRSPRRWPCWCYPWRGRSGLALAKGREGHDGPSPPVAVAVASIETGPAVQESAPSPSPTRPIVPTKRANTGREGQQARRGTPRRSDESPVRRARSRRAASRGRGETRGATAPLKPVALLGKGGHVVDPNGNCTN